MIFDLFLILCHLLHCTFASISEINPCTTSEIIVSLNQQNYSTAWDLIKPLASRPLSDKYQYIPSARERIIAYMQDLAAPKLPHFNICAVLLNQPHLIYDVSEIDTYFQLESLPVYRKEYFLSLIAMVQNTNACLLAQLEHFHLQSPTNQWSVAINNILKVGTPTCPWWMIENGSIFAELA